MRTEVISCRLQQKKKLMYGVMKAMYDGGIPLDFKGSMVLKACLIEAGFHEEIPRRNNFDTRWEVHQNAPKMKKSAILVHKVQRKVKEPLSRIRLSSTQF